MHVPDLDNSLWLLSDAGQLLLLGILIGRRLQRLFPIFSIYILWQLVADLLLFLAIQTHHTGDSYIRLFYSLLAITHLLELGVLLEIAAIVLSPAGESLRRTILYVFLAAMVVVGLCSSFMAIYANASAFSHPSVFIVMNTTAAILRLAIFLLLAGFAQVLGLSWKNHVLQLATGLAFYSVVLLVAQLAQSRLHAGSAFSSEYHFWAQVQALGYFCTLSFWCYAFAKKEAPRKEFSPQMARILVSLSGTTKRQGAVLARIRDQLQ